MIWSFEILNRNLDVLPIDEPVGFDSNKINLKRDENTHGVFFEMAGNKFQFHGESGRILKAENDQYGGQGEMYLRVKVKCSDGYEEAQFNKFVFVDFEYICGPSCYAVCPLEAIGEVMDLRNRYNQKVNLETDKAFDETTTLPAYSGLPFDLLLPSKGILLQNAFENTEDNKTPVDGVPVNDASGSTSTSNNSEYAMIEVAFNKQVATEIGLAGTQTQPRYNCVYTAAGSGSCNSPNKILMGPFNDYFIAPLDISPITNYADGTLNFGQVSDKVDVSINIPGKFTLKTVNYAIIRFIFATLPSGLSGNNESDYIFHTNNLIYSAPTTLGQVINFTATYNNSQFTLNEGDRIYCFFAFYHRVQNSLNDDNAFDIQFNSGSYIRMKTLSHTPGTVSKAFMINEAFSRATEAITNDKLRVYSDFYGRTDSEPYSTAADGCGSLKAITDGLRVRRAEEKTPGNKSVFAISLQEIFDGANAIDNIGMGIEPDPNRSGFNRLRIESWEHFYQNTVIFSCIGVNKITRKTDKRFIHSTFSIGYSKWEAEEYTGLDEFLTKRTFRTMLSSLKNEFSRLCKFIASGYASEITRRKGNDNSKDWRYDKETFVYCLTREQKFFVKFNPDEGAAGTISFDFIGNPVAAFGIPIGGAFNLTVSGSVFNDGVITVAAGYNYIGNRLTFYVVSPAITTAEETGGIEFTGATLAPGLFIELGNIDTPSNIIDPPTIYNFRISPVRNAMRWIQRVFSSYKIFSNANKVIFTDGDGNYFAKGKMQSSFCRLEDAVIQENDTIDPTKFDDPNDSKPFIGPERIVYEFPMSWSDYKLIKVNPKGLIYYENECEQGEGWIDEINYSPKKGMAEFILIPKIN